jgi:hypothetical protein
VKFISAPSSGTASAREMPFLQRSVEIPALLRRHHCA